MISAILKRNIAQVENVILHFVKFNKSPMTSLNILPMSHFEKGNRGLMAEDIPNILKQLSFCLILKSDLILPGNKGHD